MTPLVKPFIPPREILIPALEEILYSGYIATGQAVFDFEDLFRSYIGNKNIISVHSGTDALHLSYILAGIKQGDEVISTPMTAEPTNTSLKMVGAKIVWGDVDPDNGLLDPDSVLSLITERTKAIVVVHYAGMVCDMDRFYQISNKYKIPIIEDAAHALGSKHDGKMIGAESDYTIFSLQAIKHLTTVDGGFLAMKNGNQLERAQRLRWFGLDKNVSRLDNDIKEVGYKYAMNNVNATIGKVQMLFIEQNVNRYIINGKAYDKDLAGVKGIQLVKYNPNTESSYWMYTFKVEDRDNFIKMMESNGVTASPLHHRSDSHSIFKESKCELPNMDKWYSEFVHIPCGWWVDDNERNRIVDLIRQGW